MGLKITADTLFVRHFLAVLSDGVKFYESSMPFGARRFRFGQIECVLQSPDNRLSFQVGREVFTIPFRPQNQKHQAAIAGLLAALGPGAAVAEPSAHPPLLT